MGSDCGVLIEGVDERLAMDVCRTVEAETRRIEHRYSAFRQDNDLARINAAAAVGSEAEIDSESWGLIDLAKRLHQRTDGAFDITASPLIRVWRTLRTMPPDTAELQTALHHVGMEKVGLDRYRVRFSTSGMRLDFGGLGKEYAADRAADICLSAGIRHALINFAGDIRLTGPRADGAAWRIALTTPPGLVSKPVQFDLEGGAVATSGDYERYVEIDGHRFSHILDPTTGQPSTGLRTVTVLAPTCLLAGGLATAAMVKGVSGLAWLESLGATWCAITDQGIILQSRLTP